MKKLLLTLAFISSFCCQRIDAACTPPTQPKGSDTTICSGSKASLKVTNGTRFRWYNSAVGGTAIDTNAVYTTSVLFAADTYYVSSIVNSCESLRDTVIIIVKTTPKAIASKKWDKIFAGNVFSMALRNDGSLWAWGNNDNGNFGNATTDSSLVPIKVDSSKLWIDVVLGDYYAIGLKSDGTLWSTGTGALGGGGSSRNVFKQIGVSKNWIQITSGTEHVIARQKDGSLWSWGYNGEGELGDSSFTAKSSPSKIGIGSWVSVSSKGYSNVALKKDGSLWTWGRNNYGELGDSTTIDKNYPIKVRSNRIWKKAVAGGQFCIALDIYNTLWGWGMNVSGTLGDGTNTNRRIPVQIGNDSDWVDFSCGSGHVLALKKDGSFWSWGDNTFGELGDSTIISKNFPIKIGFKNAKKISAGTVHSLAINDKGQLYVWGANYDGQLGDGTISNSFRQKSPKQIGNIGNDFIHCPGGSDSLGSIPILGYNYSWTSFPSGFSSTISSPTILANQSTKCYLKVTLNGCSATDSVTITVNPLPTTNAGKDTTICVGYSPSVGMVAVSGNTYLWSSNPSGFSGTNPNISVSPTVTTTYYLAETITATGCKNSDSVVIKVNPLPTANAGSSTSICNGQSTTIGSSAVSGNTYAWVSSPTGYTSTNASNTVSPTTTTTYTLTETTTATGCTKSNSVTITVNPLPTTNAGKDTAVCVGYSPSVGMIAVSGNTYSWSSNPSGFSGTNPNISVSPTVTTTYYLAETITATGCKNSDSVTIKVNPLPKAKAGNGASICSGDSIQIGDTAKANCTYSWSATSGWSSNIAMPYVSPFKTNHYTLKVKDTITGCSNQDTVTIYIKAKPSRPKTANYNAVPCEGTALQLWCDTVIGSPTYTWDGPLGKVLTGQYASKTATLSDTGLWGVTVTVNGCTSAHRYTYVYMNAKPTVSFTGSKNVCNSSTTIYTAPTTANTIKWVVNGGSIVSGNGSTTINVKWGAAGKGYVKYIEQTNKGCLDSLTDTITINPLPKSKFSANAICLGGATNFTDSSSTTKRLWYFGDGDTTTTNNPAHTYKTSGSFTASLVVWSAAGCKDSISKTIIVNPLPAANAGANQSICNGNSTTIGGASVTGHTYLWTSNPKGFGSNISNPTVYLSATTTFYLTEKDTNTGCSKSDSVVVSMSPQPKSKFSASQECVGKATVFIDSSTNNISQVWFFGDGDTSSSKNPTHTYKTAGSFKVTLAVKSSGGCVDSSMQMVVVNPLPNAKWTAKRINGRTYNFTANDTTQNTYSWTFGDGNSASGYSTSHTYAKDSAFKVSLVVTSAQGCTALMDSNLSVITGFSSTNENNFSMKISPNPFKEQTQIQYILSQNNHVKIYVTDVLGRAVTTLADGCQSAGEYSVNFTAQKAGVYFVRMAVGDEVVVKKMVMTK